MNSPEDKSSLDERIKQSSKFLTMSPPKIPVICLKSKNSSLAELKNNRIAVPENYKVYQLMQNLRKSINLAKEEAIYLFINGECLVKPYSTVAEVYAQYKNPDGFLYIEYQELSSFGQ